MSPHDTWLAYPEPEQITARNPAGIIAKLESDGVRLHPLEGGVLAVEGPPAWFTETNRMALRQRAQGLWNHLVGENQ